MKTCQKCGAEAEKGDSYCPECGIKLKSLETRKITIWTLIKIIASILLFIVFINIFKNQPLIAIVLLLLFLMWTGIANKILQKLFNTKLSLGVKIVITVALIILFLFVAQTSKLSTTKKEIRPEFIMQTEEIMLTEEIQKHEVIQRINKAINSKDYGILEEMLGKNMITPDVFEDILQILNSREHTNVRLNLKSQNVYGNNMQLTVSTMLSTNYGEGRSETMWIFEQTNRGWKLIKITPRLSEIQLSKSFEEQTGEKIRKIPESIAVVSESAKMSTGNIIKNSYL
ncbi:MAG: hypothetical protein ISS23_03850 [Nanoarchaeota archaeon]|nr:hypothetical protein [Nanoarchaeota archaeon]